MTYARACRRAAVAALAITAMAAESAAASSGEPSPGAAEIGDPLFPGLGNGGYDVRRYRLDLRYATSAPAQAVEGNATIVARATQFLSRFNLDFAGQGPRAVWVARRPAAFVRDGAELIVTPRRALRKQRRFTVRVEGFSATPTALDPDDPTSVFFFTNPHGSATALQSDGARRVFPSNDHPRDKARFTFRIDVPAGIVAVANGVQTGHRTEGGRAIYRYVQQRPMATQLTQLAVGTYDLIRRGRHGGVEIRDLTAPTLTAAVDPKLATELGHLDWLEPHAGRYPFPIYGSFVVDVDLGYALETQTLSIFDRYWFDQAQGVWEPTMLHELAHQWFGDDVALWEWSDLWLSEGHASWYEFLFAAEKELLAEDTVDWPFPEGIADFEEYMRAIYGVGDQWRAEFGPVARPASADALFSFNSYHGGALVLYALREEMGADAFARLERAWTRHYGGRSASTGDFIGLASRVAGRDLTAFLSAWLYDTTTPPMPNHPDWTQQPVPEPATAQAAARAFGRIPAHRR